MTTDPTLTAVVVTPHEPGTARAVTIWLLVQLAGLLAITFRLKLWRGDAHDDQALMAMLAWQVAMSALLFGVVMPNVRAAICATACVPPFVQMAGVIAAAPGGAIIRGLIALVAWMTTLALCAAAFQGRTTRAIITSVASCFSVGGAALAYAHAEFAGAPDRSHSAYGPVMATISVAQSGAESASNSQSWISLTVMLVASLVMLTVTRLTRRRSR